jgi:hypothetical protein
MADTDISLKNTKNEILDAYHEALEQLKESKKTNKLQERREQEKQEVVTSASDNTPQGIIKNLANLKLTIVNALEELANQLLVEHKKLSTLQQAIQFQTKELEEIHEIKVNIDTLTALIEAQKQKKETFDQDMTEQLNAFELEMKGKRAAWKKEQEDADSLRKEQEAQQKKLRQREEEEYNYKRNLERQKEQDQYELKKQTLEKELIDKKTALEKQFAEREASIAAKENEFEQLKKQSEAFPVQLQKAIAETEKTITERLQFKYDYEAKLGQKEVEGERKLHQQTISALEIKIVQQDKLIKELTDKANFSGNQVQEIALKAIDGASRQRFYSPYPEKSTETSK